MLRVQIRYQGRVQGVGFRATARSLAQGLPLTGWVRNDPDGGVTLEAQGEPTAIDELLNRVRASLGQFIREQTRSGAPLEQGERSFDIRR